MLFQRPDEREETKAGPNCRSRQRISEPARTRQKSPAGDGNRGLAKGRRRPDRRGHKSTFDNAGRRALRRRDHSRVDDRAWPHGTGAARCTQRRQEPGEGQENQVPARPLSRFRYSV
jgi:hypothetical protein